LRRDQDRLTEMLHEREQMPEADEIPDVMETP
jgi:hypothetical protein